MKRFLLMFVVLVLILSAVKPAFSEQNIPIKKVILYKHGVGYFERLANLNKQEEITLSFKPDQMKDILKSLVLLSLDSNKPPLVNYDSQKPLEKMLEGFSIAIPRNGSLLDLLAQIKGAKVKLEVGGDAVSGTYLGLRVENEFKNDVRVEKYIVDIIQNSGGIKSFYLNDISQFILEDKELEKELDKYLKILFNYRKKESKHITIIPQTKGRVLLGYVIETPVWKTSYRVILKDAKTAVLQGWAMVDNTQDEDWEDVELSLVSGLPVSFVMDLYTPFYKQRPIVQVTQEQAVAPNISQRTTGASAELTKKSKGAYAPRKRALLREAKEEVSCEDAIGFGLEGNAPAPAPAEYKADFFEQTLESEPTKALTQEVGDLFEYKISQPVSIKQNNSALIPVAQEKIDAEMVSLYNERVRKDNPMSSLKIKNSTNLTLDGGAVTVYDNNTYVGEAITHLLKPDEKSFISYAVDLGVMIESKNESERLNEHKVTLYKGVLKAYYKTLDKKIYVINNKSGKEKIIYIEHPIRSDWKLLEPKEPEDKTKDFYRFRVPVAKNETINFMVKEEKVYYTDYYLDNISTDTIKFFLSKNFIPKKEEKVFLEIVDLKQELSRIDNKIRETQEKVQAIFKDQDRLRNNIRALGGSPSEKKLREKYVDKLDQEEEELVAFNKEIEKLQIERTDINRRLDSIFKKLFFENEL